MGTLGARYGVSEGTFDPFFRAQFPKLVVLATAMTGRRARGEEIAQEALLRAHQRWSRVAKLDRPDAWVRRVAQNLLRSHARRKAREHTAYERLHVDDAVMLADPVSARFWQTVRALPPRQREAVALYYLEDRAVADVAEIMGCKPGTVKTLLHNARRTLATQLVRGDDLP